MAENAVKVTLSSGKVILLREMKISHTEMAAREVSSKSEGDANLLSVLMQKALVRNLLISIDGEVLEPTKKEDMDSLFNMAEYSQLLSVMKELMGGEEGAKKPLIERMFSGDK